MLPFSLSRRHMLMGCAAVMAPSLAGMTVAAAAQPFATWVENFRPKAIKRGISDATYRRVMVGQAGHLGL